MRVTFGTTLVFRNRLEDSVCDAITFAVSGDVARIVIVLCCTFLTGIRFVGIFPKRYEQETRRDVHRSRVKFHTIKIRTNVRKFVRADCAKTHLVVSAVGYR